MCPQKVPMTEERKAEISLAALRLIGRSKEAIDAVEPEEAMALLGVTEEEFIEWATDLIGEEEMRKFLEDAADEPEETAEQIASRIFCPTCEIGLLKTMPNGLIVCVTCLKKFGG